MKKQLFVKAVLIAATLPLLAGCVERRVVYRDRPVYVQAPPPSQPVVTDTAPPPPGTTTTVEAPAPPPPETEVVTVAPGPPDLYVWVPGAWEWRGGWVWVGGRWCARPYHGAIWVHGGWGWRGHSRVWISAHWR